MKARSESKLLHFIALDHYDYNGKRKVNELLFALKSCKDTAPGEDIVHYSMIRNISDSAMKFLRYIFNKFFTQHLFPDKWSKAELLSLLKSNKYPKDVNSYRPIALTSCLCKLLETIIYLRFVHFLKRYELLSDAQGVVGCIFIHLFIYLQE